MITTAHRMESLSRAYLQAVAAQAGLNYSVHAYDYGIDITLREVERAGEYYIDTGRVLDVQLRSTGRAAADQIEIRFDLDVRTYDHLRVDHPKGTRILMVMLVPQEEADWVSLTERGLLIGGEMYWLLLRGRPSVPNAATIRLAIPRHQMVTGSALQQLLELPTGGAEA
jgi:Domain of unknown function (DUF4365)